MSSSQRTILGLAVVWLALFGFFAWRVPGGGFGTVANLELLARQTAIVGFAALGMTFVIVAGAIDLSIGSTVALTTVLIAWSLEHSASPAVACLIGLAGALAIGSLNGLLTNVLRVSSFIVTLGSLLLIRGAAKGLAGEQKIDAPMTWLADVLARLGPDKKWMILPPGVWLLVLCAVAAHILLSRTPFGRRTVAVGSNERAALYSGVNPNQVRLGVFTIGGLFAGLAGIMQFSRLTVGDPTVAAGLELDVIAAVVIGGASLSGGRGTILGSLLGALLMSTIRAGCSQMGLDNWIQEMITGGIIVAAVALDRVRNQATK